MRRHAVLSPARWAAILAVVLIVAACGGPSTTAPPAGTSPGRSPALASPAGSPSAPACPDAAPPSPEGPWWRDRVFYEAFVRSFSDSDGDGIGDLRGLTDRLDHLNDGDPSTMDDLGVTALWLMPVAASPSYHGYDVTDYEAIEPDYGTPDDFHALIDAAHERGIEVIVDLVINHTSIDHPWFQDARIPGSTHDDWYVWSTEGVRFAGPSGQRVWHKHGDRWYYGYFWEGMPDLNLANPEVTAALDDVARFWLDEMGVDGFRIDAARHLIEDGDQLQNTPATFDWLAGFRERVKTSDPEALVLGEVWDATSMSSRYVREGSLDLTFDFGLAGATINAIRSGDAESLRAAQQEVADDYPSPGAATFLTNHDQNRVADQLGGDPAALRLAATLLLTGQGVPFVYYGEEIGLTGHKPDEQIRTPMRWDESVNGGFTTGMPWEPLSPDPVEVNVATQAADPASLLSTYRALVRLRAAHPALSHGDWTPLEASDPGLLAFLRQADGETVVVAANLADRVIETPALSLDDGTLCGSPTASSLLGPAEVGGPIVTVSGGLEGYVPVDRLGPRETVVIGLEP